MWPRNGPTNTSGQFDDGWDAYRAKTLERQKKLGIVPQDTELTDRPELFPAWDSLSDAQKKLYVRQMEVFAGFSENADWNVGRLLDAIDDLGDLDNTLIFYIWGDNGASMEGTITGSFNEMTFLNGVALDADHQLALIETYGGIEELGGDHTAPHFAAAWAHANNTPFQWGKQMASHLGGARDPMVVAWPSRIRPDTQVRTQFTHCIDIAPTVLEAAGLPEPTSVDGIDQEPMDGTSFLDTFEHAGAEERHTVQYFEMVGSRAIYQEGWWACARLDKAPWDFTPETMKRFAPGVYDPDKDVWELYYLPDDFSQAKNLAADQPRETGRTQGAVLAGGRTQPGPAAAGRDGRVLRHAATDADDDPVHVQRRRAKHSARHDSPHPRPLLRHRGAPQRSRRWRPRGDRGQRRLHRGLRVVGRRATPAASHLLLPGCRDLQAGVHPADPAPAMSR